MQHVVADVSLRWKWFHHGCLAVGIRKVALRLRSAKARRSEWWMRRHPTAPANVAGSVATFGTDFTAPEAEFVTLVPVCWLLCGRSCSRYDRGWPAYGVART